jgi:hypothetical protein
VAEAQEEAQPESEWQAPVADAQDEAQPESEWAAPVAQAEPMSESEWLAPVAQAEPELETAAVAADDIWYSGAPDAELPSAELVTDEPVAVATGSDRSDGFVWIPADDERD